MSGWGCDVWCGEVTYRVTGLTRLLWGWLLKLFFLYFPE